MPNDSEGAVSVARPTLTGFLLARIDEDYEVAWGAEPSPWREGAWDGQSRGAREVLGRHGDVTAVCYYGGTYGHVLRFDPSRVIRDLAAKRRIVERAADVGFGYPSHHLAQGILALLALPYADHPDYRDEWRP
jgi:hypothetical protein